jgi:predicted lipoprotein
MSSHADNAAPRRPALRRRTLIIGAAALALVAAMAIDTKVVTIGSDEDVQAGVFSPETYGAETFPTVQAAVEARAVDAKVLADAIVADRKAAEAQYGVAAGAGPVMAVKFSGVAGAVKSGMYDVAVEGMPEKLRIRVQTGPAVNGTDVRDATGTITFGQFTNQIEYQDAGSALNNEVKKQVLQKLDTTALTGKTLSVVGVFKLVNPNSWLVTPVRLEVQ